MLFDRRSANQRWRTYADMLVAENIWRAQRYGLEGPLLDFGRGVLVPFAELMEELIDLVRSEAEALGCLKEVEGVRRIMERGTSADRQLTVYKAAVDAGAAPEEALAAVVDLLIEDTRAGI
jgi:carboxylate-amine ligase